jgi:endonuclease G
MKKILYLLCTASFVLSFTACSGGDDDNGGGTTPTPVVVNINKNVLSSGNSQRVIDLEFPHTKGGSNLVVSHFTSNGELNYSYEWDCTKKANRWSCYKMYKSNRTKNTSRYSVPYPSDDYYSKQYPTDPDLPSQYGWTAGRSTDPYWGSGYAHGHICPSADRLNSVESNYQTFYLTNMTPMNGTFNSGIWGTMEAQVRTWIDNAITNDTKNFGSDADTLYVCKGGTIDDSNQTLASIHGLTVPKYYYCALLMKNHEGYKAIGFWFEHKETSAGDLSPYVVNIDTLEQLTGLDFFCNLPDETENKVEGLALENVKKAWGM